MEVEGQGRCEETVKESTVRHVELRWKQEQLWHAKRERERNRERRCLLLLLLLLLLFVEDDEESQVEVEGPPTTDGRTRANERTIERPNEQTKQNTTTTRSKQAKQNKRTKRGTSWCLVSSASLVAARTTLSAGGTCRLFCLAFT